MTQVEWPLVEKWTGQFTTGREMQKKIIKEEVQTIAAVFLTLGFTSLQIQ